MFSEVWDGVDCRTDTKMPGSEYRNDICTFKHDIYINKYPRFSIVLPLIVSRSPITGDPLLIGYINKIIFREHKHKIYFHYYCACCIYCSML